MLRWTMELARLCALNYLGYWREIDHQICWTEILPDRRSIYCSPRSGLSWKTDIRGSDSNCKLDVFGNEIQAIPDHQDCHNLKASHINV